MTDPIYLSLLDSAAAYYVAYFVDMCHLGSDRRHAYFIINTPRGMQCEAKTQNKNVRVLAQWMVKHKIKCSCSGIVDAKTPNQVFVLWHSEC